MRAAIINLLTRAKGRATRALLRAAAAVDGHFAEQALVLVAARAPEALCRFVHERASGMAVGITMAILDRERIAHCHRCPQRFGLRRHGGLLACLNHPVKEEAAAVAA